MNPNLLLYTPVENHCVMVKDFGGDLVMEYVFPNGEAKIKIIKKELRKKELIDVINNIKNNYGDEYWASFNSDKSVKLYIPGSKSEESEFFDFIFVVNDDGYIFSVNRKSLEEFLEIGTRSLRDCDSPG